MAEWCADNLWNCDGWKTAGLELSTPNHECAKALDASIRQLVSWTDCPAVGGFHETLKRLETSDPDSIMARSFIIGLTGLGTEAAARDSQYAQQMDQLERDIETKGNEREKAHARAAILWGRGKHLEAARAWDDILNDYPNDLIAVKFSHDAHFFNGSSSGKLNAIEKIINKWNPSQPCYSFLHGMYAFGLEECAIYDKAEKEANRALELNRYDCWATHAKAHVLEMNGRHKEGKKMMYDTEDNWRKGWMLATHNYWHTALFHIEYAEYESALSIFDREVADRFNRTKSLLDMVDATSLLWRLEIEGVDVGKQRWRKIEELGRFIDNHSIVFNDVHLGLALKRQDEHETQDALRQSLIEYSGLLSEDNAKLSKTVGLPLYDGMQDFASGKYDEAVKKMYPIRNEVVKIGGSHAQRDVFSQTLIRACIMSSDEENWKKAPELLKERNSLKPNSELGKRLADKYRLHHPIEVF